jgi:hypothetical protein
MSKKEVDKYLDFFDSTTTVFTKDISEDKQIRVNLKENDIWIGGSQQPIFSEHLQLTIPEAKKLYECLKIVMED